MTIYTGVIHLPISKEKLAGFCLLFAYNLPNLLESVDQYSTQLTVNG